MIRTSTGSPYSGIATIKKSIKRNRILAILLCSFFIAMLYGSVLIAQADTNLKRKAAVFNTRVFVKQGRTINFSNLFFVVVNIFYLSDIGISFGFFCFGTANLYFHCVVSWIWPWCFNGANLSKLSGSGLFVLSCFNYSGYGFFYSNFICRSKRFDPVSQSFPCSAFSKIWCGCNDNYNKNIRDPLFNILCFDSIDSGS